MDGTKTFRLDMIKQMFLDLKGPLSEDMAAHGPGDKFHVGFLKAICFVSQ